MNDRSSVINIEDIVLSKRELELGFHLPVELTEDLAYFCGLLMGDGHLCFDKERGDYLIDIGGNPADEKPFYDLVVVDIIKRLFGIKLKANHLNGGTYGIRFQSKSLLVFLIQKLGMPYGKKCGIAFIPDTFKSSEHLFASFIQGFADADFSLYLRRRYKEIPYYPTIGGCSKSRRIIEEISSFLTSKGITCSTSFDRVTLDKRTNKFYGKSWVYVYGVKNLFSWMKLIGFRNPKYLNIFESVREKITAEFGFEPNVYPRYFRIPYTKR